MSLPSALRGLSRKGRATLTSLLHPRAEARARKDARTAAGALEGLLHAVQPAPGGRRILVVSLTDDTQQVVLETVLTKALQVRGGEIFVLAGRSHRTGTATLRRLSAGRLVFYEDYAPARANWHARGREAIRGFRTMRDFKEYQYRGARIGRQALSSVVRARYEPRIDLNDPEFQEAVAAMVGAGMQSVETSERLLDDVKPDALLMIERGYTGVGAIFDTALARGIPVIQFMASHRDDAFVLKRYTLENRELHPRSLDAASWERLRAEPFGQEEESRLTAELAQRDDAQWFLARRFRHFSRSRPAEELRRDLGLDSRKIAVLFSHVLWDASMFYGSDVFDDQGQWFAETIRLAAQDDSVQWLVKLHPALYWKHRNEGIEAEPAELSMIRDAVGELPDHMRLVSPDADIANADLFELVDVGVTIRGTVALELPPLGVPVLTAGTSDFTGHGFTLDAADRAEYERNVRGIAQLGKLDSEQTRLARLYAYGVFCRRPWHISSFALEYLPLDEAGDTLEHRVRVHLRDEAALRAADDLRQFAEWVLHSDEPDFLASR